MYFFLSNTCILIISLHSPISNDVERLGHFSFSFLSKTIFFYVNFNCFIFWKKSSRSFLYFILDLVFLIPYNYIFVLIGANELYKKENSLSFNNSLIHWTWNLFFNIEVARGAISKKEKEKNEMLILLERLYIYIYMCVYCSFFCWKIILFLKLCTIIRMIKEIQEQKNTLINSVKFVGGWNAKSVFNYIVSCHTCVHNKNIEQ